MRSLSEPAFPHLLKSFAADLPWRNVVFSTSALSFLGGLAMVSLVPDGPYRKRSPRLDLTAFLRGYSNKNFRSASLGYFGHMWELYTFWAFVPVMLQAYSDLHGNTGFNVSLLSFIIIGGGGLACVVSGLLSLNYGAKKIATLALALSGLCCILSPLFSFDGFSPCANYLPFRFGDWSSSQTHRCFLRSSLRMQQKNQEVPH